MLRARTGEASKNQSDIVPLGEEAALERLIRRDAAAARVLTLVATARGVPTECLLGRSRPKEIAAARQIAMYLVHVMLSRTLAEVGSLFRRDRTTVGYACALVEDRRDDRTFDDKLCEIEAKITALNTGTGTDRAAA